jgi:hypothetical protein
MYEFPPPGDEQQKLDMLAGDWSSEVRFYFDPAAEPMVKPGTYRATLDLGGYFLRREFRVDLDDAGDFKALAFHGFGLTGYDPFQRKYCGFWADSGSPAIYRTEATFDPSGDVYTETSHGPDPTGEPMRLRMVTTRHDPDHLQFNLFRTDDSGGETLVTEMRHTRV